MLSVAFALAGLMLAGVACARPAWPWIVASLVSGAACLATSPSVFVLTKAISRLAMPPGLLWLLQLAALGVGLRHGARWVPWLLAFTLLYSLAGNVWLGSGLLRILEGPYRAAPRLALDAPLDALWVLGGGTTVDPDGAPRAGTAGDRLVTAARLWHQGGVRHLIASGTSVGGIQQDTARSLGAETLVIWSELKIPQEAMTAVDGPRNTREELEALAAWMAARPGLRVGLLTSAWHLRRAMGHARRLGLDVVPIGADFRGERPTLGLVGLVPSAAGFDRVKTALREGLGAAVGR